MTTKPTQADIEGAEAYLKARVDSILKGTPAQPIFNEPRELTQAFAAHRIASTAALQARVETLEAALVEMIEAVCGETGFAQAVRADSGFAYPWPALDMAEVKARKALGGNDA